ADGSNVIASTTWDQDQGPLLGSIWISTDSGTTWTSNKAAIIAWRNVSCSADGTHYFAFNYDDGFFISTNHGISWTKSTPGTSDYLWTYVAASADGNRLLAGGEYVPPDPSVEQSAVAISGDGGLTWSRPLITGPTVSYTTGVALSADGSRLAAVGSSGLLL